LRHGWSDQAGAFAQYFGSDELDASNLMIPIVGFLPAADPRVLATIDAIAERLTDERGLVYRYDTRGGVDGLEGREGTFVLCTFWLAQTLALAGQPERARNVFERAISYLNDVGLLAEEVDPAAGELLGNFPRPSATSGSSTPPGPSPKPSAGRPPLAAGRPCRGSAGATEFPAGSSDDCRAVVLGYSACPGATTGLMAESGVALPRSGRIATLPTTCSQTLGHSWWAGGCSMCLRRGMATLRVAFRVSCSPTSPWKPG
jgi:glycosyl hydrolase family 15